MWLSQFCKIYCCNDKSNKHILLRSEGVRETLRSLNLSSSFVGIEILPSCHHQRYNKCFQWVLNFFPCSVAHTQCQMGKNGSQTIRGWCCQFLRSFVQSHTFSMMRTCSCLIQVKDFTVTFILSMRRNNVSFPATARSEKTSVEETRKGLSSFDSVDVAQISSFYFFW